jgi:hypothetical protein
MPVSEHTSGFQVPLSRHELVSDWQCRLAVADSLDAGAGSQPAWLARVQQRLYRFLLSLYGSGHWRASARLGDETEVPAGDAPLAIFEAPEVLPLAGKPAKETGKIRAVLKSVAAAQDQPLAAGPLVAGLPAQYWVAVAVVKSAIDPTACVKLLRSRGLTVRVSNRGQGAAIEVPAIEHRVAIKLLLARKRHDLFRKRAAALRIPALLFWTLAAATFAPIVAMAVLLFTEAVFQNPHSVQAKLYALALFCVCCSLVFVRPIARAVPATHRLLIRLSEILQRQWTRK